jgi:hypothetical protein
MNIGRTNSVSNQKMAFGNWESVRDTLKHEIATTGEISRKLKEQSAYDVYQTATKERKPNTPESNWTIAEKLLNMAVRKSTPIFGKPSTYVDMNPKTEEMFKRHFGK